MEAYYSVRDRTFDKVFTRTFRNLPATFGAEEAEEVGTEHLLRDLRNATTSTLASKVSDKCLSQVVLWCCADWEVGCALRPEVPSDCLPGLWF